jgi:hypothetical protein
MRGLPGDPDCLLVDRLRPWLTVVSGETGREHAVLSDGCHHIRLDVVSGRLADHSAVRMRFSLDGLTRAQAGVLPLQRLLALHRHGRFGKMLYPHDPTLARGIGLLRVCDALDDGASHRDLACVLVGSEVVQRDWNDPSDSLRSRIRRLARQAKAMAMGGYKDLMRR